MFEHAAGTNEEATAAHKSAKDARESFITVTWFRGGNLLEYNRTIDIIARAIYTGYISHMRYFSERYRANYPAFAAAAILLMGTTSGDRRHEHFTLPPEPVMHVSVPFGNVILRPHAGTSKVYATVDYPGGVSLSAAPIPARSILR